MRRVWWLAGGLLLAVLVIAGSAMFSAPSRNEAPHVAFSQFLIEAGLGRVGAVTIVGHEIRGGFTDGKAFGAYAPVEAHFYLDQLLEKGVLVAARPEEPDIHPLLQIMLSWGGMIVFLVALRLVGVRMVASGEAALARRVAALEARIAGLKALPTPPPAP